MIDLRVGLAVERVRGAVGESDDRQRVVGDRDRRVGAVEPGYHEARDPHRRDCDKCARQVVHVAHERHRRRVEQEHVAERERQLTAQREPRELDVTPVPAAGL